MKEIKTILENLKSASLKNKKAALATVVNVHGSSYRGVGARMLIVEDGFWFGSVSGGCLEEDVINKARKVMDSKQAELFKYDTRQNAKNSFGMGYGCNGLLEVLLEPIEYSEADPACTMLNQIAEEPGLQGLSTVFYSDDSESIPIGLRHHSNGRTYIMDEELDKQIREDLQYAVKNNEPKAKTYKVNGKKVKVIHEVFRPNINILIYGAVFHVVPFLRITNELGYNVKVTDSFEPIQPIWNFPNANELNLLDEDEVNHFIKTTPNLAVVFLTHNFFYIKEELPKVLRSEARYVGILGSRKKTEKILKEARVNEEHYSEEELAKIHYPVGLDIGANTPEEIALSIIAEIKTFLSDRTGKPLRNFDGYIHKRNLAEA